MSCPELKHLQVRKHVQDSRYAVALKGASSSSATAIVLGKEQTATFYRQLLKRGSVRKVSCHVHVSSYQSGSHIIIS